MTISEGPIIVIQNNQVFAVSRKLVYYTKIYFYWNKDLLQGIHGNAFFEFDITMLKPFDMYKNIYFEYNSFCQVFLWAVEVVVVIVWYL